MPQLVGMKCVVCQEKITNELHSRFCPACGKPRHDECARGPDGTAPDQCRECGVPGAVVPAPRAERPPPSVPQGPFPVARACPKCASASYRKVKPLAWVAFVWDRVCKECGTRYTPPTPGWAALVFLGAGLLLASGSLLGAVFSVAAGDVLGLACIGCTGLMGCLAIFHGVRSLLGPSDV